MTKPKLFVALITSHGSIQQGFLAGAMELFQKRSFDMDVRNYMNPYFELSRNDAACDFMFKTDCTHMLFIDVDIVFAMYHVWKLLDRDVDVVGGIYCKKAQTKAPEWVGNALPDRPPPEPNGLVKMKHIGTGFLMIKREVFERVINLYGDEILYYENVTNARKYDFFPTGVKKDEKGVPRWVSEDWWFCDRCREMGYTVWGDTNVILEHIGTVIFPLDTQKEESRKHMAEDGVSAKKFHEGQMKVHNAACE